MLLTPGGPYNIWRRKVELLAPESVEKNEVLESLDTLGLCTAQEDLTNVQFALNPKCCNRMFL